MKTLWAVLTFGLAFGAGTAVQAAGPACVAGDYVQKARALIQPYVEAKLFSGSVLVARDGKAVFQQGFGLANQEWNVPNSPDTKFRLGSITKGFTATAILQLAEQGKLSIDDPVSKYYPAAPPAWAKITVKNLLTHTSGIPTYTALPKFFEADARLKHTPEEIIKLTRDKPLQFEPGAGYAYDNSGYILLGYIVEKVSGQAYADYIQGHIFAPLGMRDSGYDSSEKITPRRAAGYEPGPNGWVNAAYLDMSVPYAAGSLYSTVDDILIWDQALYAAKPLKPASLQQMFTDYGHHYGFGWEIDTQYGHDRISHNGGINGFGASFQRYPKDGLTVVTLSNYAGAPVDRIAAQLVGLCLGVEVPPATVALPVAVLDSYVGDYQVSPISTMAIVRDGDHLAMRPSNQPPGQPPSAIYAKGERAFFSKVADIQITFDAPVNGKARGLVVMQNGATDPQRAPRVDAAQARAVTEALAKRFRDQLPAPGSEAALRRDIDELRRGQPSYDQMSPVQAAATRQQLQGLQGLLTGMGDLQTVTFKGVGPAGFDIYEVAFAKGKTEWRILMAADGKIESMNLRPIP